MIILFENFSKRKKTRKKAEDLSKYIISFAKEFFKNSLIRCFTSCFTSWIKTDLCQVQFRFDGWSVLFCEMKLKSDPLLGTEFILINFRWSNLKKIGSEETFKPIYDYLNDLFGNNIAYTVNDFDVIISKLNLEDYEIWKEANKYNL